MPTDELTPLDQRTSEGSGWAQIHVEFTDWHRAEHTAAHQLRPLLDNEAGTAGWWFVRKHPCWRLRYRPADEDAPRRLARALDDLVGMSAIRGWTPTIYEPETCAFGGPASMDFAHELFHQDSRHIFAHLKLLGDRTLTSEPPGQDQRRELSVLLCAALMRAAGQDRYEQGDIWAKVADHRPTKNSTQPAQWSVFTAAIKRLVTVNTGPETALRTGGALESATDWLTVFEQAGKTLKILSDEGLLTRGIRAVIAHHIIFHWNRIGLPYPTQANIALAAKEVIFEDRYQ